MTRPGFDQSEIDAVMEQSSKRVQCLTRSNYSAAFERCQLQKAQSVIKGLEWSDSAVLPKYKGERYVDEYSEAGQVTPTSQLIVGGPRGARTLPMFGSTKFFQQTHNLGLRQLFLTVSRALRP